MTEMLDKLRFPVGKFTKPESITEEERRFGIAEIKSFPSRLTMLAEALVTNQLSYRYRPDGWSIRQVIHHCADSHMNAFIRFKLTLTEDRPTIRPYDQSRWAMLADGDNDEIGLSLAIINNVHRRWIMLMENMTSDDWQRQYVHPEYNSVYTLDQALANYEWHCRHHYQHVVNAINFKTKYT